MDIIRKPGQMNEYHSKVFDMYFKGMSFAAFDIETTGLSPSSSQVILSGFCSCRGGKCETVQFFAESLSEEAELLEKTLAYMSGFDFAVTYNGRRFDTPFTIRRARRHNIERHLTDSYPYDFDIYPLVRRFSDIASFVPNLRQKTLENFMGLWSTRSDKIDGGDSVRMYYDYLVSRSDNLKEKILLHNHDDVVQLYRLLAVTGRADMHAAMRRLGFPVATHRGTFTITKSNIKGDSLIIRGKQPPERIKYRYPGDGYFAFEFDRQGSFTIELATEQHDELLLADLTRLPVSEAAFSSLPTYGSGYLVLRREAHGKNKGTENHMEINLLAQQMLAGIISEI